MLETFQDRLVTELHLAAANTINGVGLVLKESVCWKRQGECRSFPGNIPDPG